MPQHAEKRLRVLVPVYQPRPPLRARAEGKLGFNWVSVYYNCQGRLQIRLKTKVTVQTISKNARVCAESARIPIPHQSVAVGTRAHASGRHGHLQEAHGLRSARACSRCRRQLCTQTSYHARRKMLLTRLEVRLQALLLPLRVLLRLTMTMTPTLTSLPRKSRKPRNLCCERPCVFHHSNLVI